MFKDSHEIKWLMTVCCFRLQTEVLMDVDKEKMYCLRVDLNAESEEESQLD